ncbi:helix-turn-helix domain-containing protein [Pantanalinema sp. GBBB05]|uniref:helix-turn-helix domain-containing protein n=1 Tax=Pantanalinema sp. GBBB05 TaxID=2604139 RepID=UPI001DDF87CE|nr:helix-turn-helix transcriptional regulator [Pantanalinema sp. GBBB05]
MAKVRQIIKREVEVSDLGDRIRRAREADKRGVTALAKAVGVSRAFWYQMETDSTPSGGIAEATLRRVEEVLGIDFGVRFEE